MDVAGALEYRIGTAEREQVRALLERHAAEGRLTLDEFGDRIDEVWRARTAADLDHALRELPHAAAPQPARVRLAPAWRVPPVLPVLAVALLVFGLLAAVGSFWPVWILLLVARFAFFGGRGRRGWDRGRDGGPPWRGHHRQHHHDSYQTRWV